MSDALRRLARDRAGGRCEYCQLPDSLPPLEPFHLEHIVARQHGGRTETENLAWACHRCNYYKGPNLTGIDPETQMVVPLFHPRRAVWNLHFDLQGFRFVGLTGSSPLVSNLKMLASLKIQGFAAEPAVTEGA